jgi:hypothetical protein
MSLSNWTAVHGDDQSRGVQCIPITRRPAAVLNRMDHDEQLIQIRLVGMRMNTSVSSAVRG